MITATFGPDSLTFATEEETKSVALSYRDHPEVFGHPRFIMSDFDKSRDLVRDSLRQVAGRWTFPPPKVTLRIERTIAGGITAIDRKILYEIFTHAGARDVIQEEAEPAARANPARGVAHL